jgi:hypothetical protein
MVEVFVVLGAEIVCLKNTNRASGAKIVVVADRLQHYQR